MSLKMTEAFCILAPITKENFLKWKGTPLRSLHRAFVTPHLEFVIEGILFGAMKSNIDTSVY